MANWKITSVFGSLPHTSGDFLITKALGRYGDALSGRTYSDGPIGLHWLTRGSVVVVNGLGDKMTGDSNPTGVWRENEAMIERLSPEIYVTEVGTVIAQEMCEYYCITDPAKEDRWRGDIYAVVPGDVTHADGVLGKRLFVATGTVKVNNVVYEAGSVAMFSTIDEVDVVCTAASSFAIFYKEDPV